MSWHELIQPFYPQDVFLPILYSTLLCPNKFPQWYFWAFIPHCKRHVKNVWERALVKWQGLLVRRFTCQEDSYPPQQASCFCVVLRSASIKEAWLCSFLDSVPLEPHPGNHSSVGIFVFCSEVAQPFPFKKIWYLCQIDHKNIWTSWCKLNL